MCPQAEVDAVKAAMQRRVEEAVAETEAKATTLRDAREKNVHLSARVVALNSRQAQLSKQLADARAREKGLLSEMESTRSMSKAAQTQQRVSPRQNGACSVRLVCEVSLLFCMDDTYVDLVHSYIYSMLYCESCACAGWQAYGGSFQACPGWTPWAAGSHERQSRARCRTHPAATSPAARPWPWSKRV